MKKQKAKIGDKIIVVNTMEESDFQNGEILNVLDLWDDRCHGEDFYGVVVDKYDECGLPMDLFEEEYELCAPIKEEFYWML